VRCCAEDTPPTLVADDFRLPYISAMLEYLHALGLVILFLGVASIALMSLGFWFSHLVQSRVGRVVVVWPLFALGGLALGAITLLLAINMFGVIRMLF
jgi:hypothetical protein